MSGLYPRFRIYVGTQKRIRIEGKLGVWLGQNGFFLSDQVISILLY